MNKQELIESISHLPSDCSGQRPMVDKLTTLELVKLLDEPQKVKVPQFMADLIEEAITYEWDLDDLFEHISEYSGDSEVSIWFYTLGNIDVLARAWLEGYTVEIEKRYYVRFKFIEDSYSYLTLIKHLHAWTLTNIKLDKKFRSEHTKKQLEDAGFGWVFDCPGIEIEEVE